MRMMYISDSISKLTLPKDSIFKTALDFKVTKRLLKDLENCYGKGKPTNLKLASGYDGKSIWKMNVLSPMKENVNYEQQYQLRTPVK